MPTYLSPRLEMLSAVGVTPRHPYQPHLSIIICCIVGACDLSLLEIGDSFIHLHHYCLFVALTWKRNRRKC